MAVVAVMVLIGVLFLTGTVMALAVSSNLHTVDVMSNHDASHYAAESAVARGVASVIHSQPCPSGGSINEEALVTWCEAASTTQPGEGDSQLDSLRQWAIRSQRLDPGTCVSISLPPSDSAGKAWTVIAWRGASDVRVWLDSSSGCSPVSATPCAQNPILANVRYVRCTPAKGRSQLHIAVRNAGVDLGASVVRWAPADADPIRTVVGASGVEVDEADVVSPTDGSSPTQVFWNTVLP